MNAPLYLVTGAGGGTGGVSRQVVEGLRARGERVRALVLSGEPFSSRHRIIDTAGRTHWVIVVGDVMCDEAGAPIGTTGFYAVIECLRSGVAAGMSLPDPADRTAQHVRVVA